ncbi:MAG: hypothetical protein IJG49_08125 [Erysipelotrichaceae bacterium]|nr:hypothetical protein [Erysipelotrichaceae bacterium]
MRLTQQQCRKLYGLGLTGGSLLLYFALAAIGAGILKILFSARGKVQVGGVSLTWGN